MATTIAMIPIKPTAAPIPIPAFTPVERSSAASVGDAVAGAVAELSVVEDVDELFGGPESLDAITEPLVEMVDVWLAIVGTAYPWTAMAPTEESLLKVVTVVWKP